MIEPVPFTVLIPVWRGDDPAQFAQALESIERATVTPAEVIICQDGEAPAPLEAVVRRSRARVARNPGPPGLAHNLNHAMGEVRTAWVARADADDVNRPGRFEAQARFLAANPRIAVLGGRIVEVAPDGARRDKPMPLTHEAIVRRARWRNPINHMTAFVNVEAFRACGGYPPIPYKEDYALWLTMIDRGFQLANLDEVLVEARLGAGFYRRRTGAHNFASERALYALKRGMPAIGPAPALAAWLARSGALAFSAPARLIYERALRR